VNGWNTNVLAGNGMRTVGGAVTWKPCESAELVVDYLGGPERAATRLADATLTMRHELDTYAVWELTPGVALAASADYGHDAARGGASWSGVAGYVSARPLEWLAFAARGEHFFDDEGFITGTGQRITELTLTAEGRFSLAGRTPMVRLEFRRDTSDEPVFGRDLPRALTHQDTLTVAFVAAVF
jgi:hypothetical protein